MVSGLQSLGLHSAQWEEVMEDFSPRGSQEAEKERGRESKSKSENERQRARERERETRRDRVPMSPSGAPPMISNQTTHLNGPMELA